MKPLFFVSTEGGPLLIADLMVLREWRGSDEEDYDDLCREMQELKRDVLKLAGEHGNALGWDIGGPGCTYVVRMEDGGVRVVVANLEENFDRDFSAQLATMEGDATRAATIDIPSGVLGIVWAVESGERAPRTMTREVRELPDTSMGHGGGLIRVEAGRYHCWTDEVSSDDGDARRLTLRLDAASVQVNPASR